METISAGVAWYLRRTLAPPQGSGQRVCTPVVPYNLEDGTLVTEECHFQVDWSNDPNTPPPAITGLFPANIPGVEDLAGTPVNQLYRWTWIPSEQEGTPGYWNFTPLEPRLNYEVPHTSQSWWQGFTDWNQWRPAFEYVGTALATAYIGGEVFAPVAGESAGVAVDLAADAAPALGADLGGGATFELGAGAAPAIEGGGELAQLAGTIEPAVTTTSGASLLGSAQQVVGAVGTVQRAITLVNPPRPPIRATQPPGAAGPPAPAPAMQPARGGAAAVLAALVPIAFVIFS